MSTTRLSLAGILVALAVGCTTAQKTTIPESQAFQRIEVTAQVIASLPAGEEYRVDLSRQATVYALATDIDRSCVRFSGRAREIEMTDLVESLGPGVLLVGSLEGLRGQKLDGLLDTSAMHDHSCGVLFCTCDHAGCTLLLLEGKCVNDKLICDAEANCICMAKS